MFDLENSIKQWLRLFSKHRAFNHGSLREMELHLRDHIDDLISGGCDEQDAFEQAVKEFGEIPKMATEEYSNIQTKTTFKSIIFTTMLNNYFKTSLRSLMRNPLTSFINIFGLSVSIGICVLVYAFIAQDISTDRFHKNKYQVYLVTSFVNRDGTESQYGLTPAPLGKTLKEDFAQIKKVCRIKDGAVVLKYEDKVFHENVRYTDPEFLEMFTFPLKWGFASTLVDKNSIIFSENLSIKYFGEENPIGQNILLKFGENNTKTFTITGVAETFPKAHDIDFDLLINFENYKVSNPDFDQHDWGELVDATLIQVNAPLDVKLVEQGMERYRRLQNKVKNDWEIESFAIEQLAGLHEKKIGEIRNSIAIGYPPEGRIVMPIIAIFMLLLACFNYINIAIVSSAKRLKEIGIRKVIGANRGLVIVQFLSENIFITFFAMIIGLILGTSIFIPWFNNLFPRVLEIVFFDKNLWIFLASILLFTGLASGLYPAIFISKFNAIKIFKGSVQFGNKNPLTKVFLSIQLVLACIAIVGGVMFTLNTTYIANRSWGYDANDALYVDVPDRSAYDQLKTAMSQNPNVLLIAGSNHHLGESHTKTIVHMPERQYEVYQFSVDANYFKTLGLQLVDGRVFIAHSENDKQAVVVNEMLVKKMELTPAIGQVFKIDSTRYEVIGVVRDFHTQNFDYKIRPTVFKIAEFEDYRFLSMKVRKGTKKETYKELQAQWLTLFPEIPFQGGHQNDVFKYYFDYLDSTSEFMKALAFIAVLLAGLGLYGLVTLNVSGRVREFSIRKILGAGINNIANNITRQYIILFAVSLAIGAPISYAMIGGLLDMIFAYHIPMSYSGVVISVLILLFVLLMVIFVQIRKVIKSNPVDGLRSE